jgi:hypothetical protein
MVSSGNPKVPTLKSHSEGCQRVTSLTAEVFAEVTGGKCGQQGGPQPHVTDIYKKVEFGQRHTGEDQVEAQGENATCKPRREASGDPNSVTL